MGRCQKRTFLPAPPMRSTLVVLLALPSARALPGSTFSSLQPAWNVTVPRVLDWSCSSRNQKVAYIHIPKTGGESLLYSLRQAKAPACNGGTLLSPNNMCACGKRWYAEGFPPLARQDNSRAVCGTGAGTEIAVMEQTHNAFFQYWDGPAARSPCTFWLSTVRDPEDWFYSAVSQWCSNGGSGTQACSGVTYERLLELGWWASPAMSKAISSSKEIKYSRAHRTPLPACRPPLTSAQPFGRYYFVHDDLQTTMLDGISAEANWGICTLTHIDRVFSVLPHLLPSRPKILDQHANKNHWAGLASFKKLVPWAKVKKHYAIDQQFYDDVSEQGCVRRTTDAESSKYSHSTASPRFKGKVLCQR